MFSNTHIFLSLLGLACMAGCMEYRPLPANFGSEYLGVRYETDPLGEGFGYDADPLIRNDAFDCQTYIETVMACGNQERLTQIRYAGGVPDFLSRNHFFSADWLKNNANLVENISADFGNTAIRSGVIDKKSWFTKVHGINTDFTPMRAEIKYVPYSNIKNTDTDMPVLVAFVSDNPAVRDRIGSDILVSHVGFLIPGGVLRHASSSAGKVVDVKFDDYIAIRAGTKTDLGVAFFKIKELCK